jgi:hypothetical protein
LTDATYMSGSSTALGSGGCTVGRISALAAEAHEGDGPWKVVLGLGVATLLAARRRKSA